MKRLTTVSCKIGEYLSSVLKEFDNDLARISEDVSSYSGKMIVVVGEIEQAIPEQPEPISFGAMFTISIGHLVSVNEDKAMIGLLSRSVGLYPQHFFDEATLELIKADEVGTQPYLAVIRKEGPLYHLPEGIEQWKVVPTAYRKEGMDVEDPALLAEELEMQQIHEDEMRHAEELDKHMEGVDTSSTETQDKPEVKSEHTPAPEVHHSPSVDTASTSSSDTSSTDTSSSSGSID